MILTGTLPIITMIPMMMALILMMTMYLTPPSLPSSIAGVYQPVNPYLHVDNADDNGDIMEVGDILPVDAQPNIIDVAMEPEPAESVEHIVGNYAGEDLKKRTLQGMKAYTK